MRAALVLSILFLSCVTAVQGQETDWGDWKSTPNFPQIQIRSRCQYHSSSEGDSDWNYQIRSNYKERVYVTYKDEKRSSTPSNIVFSTPGGFYLNSGEESAVHDDYVTGDCNRSGGVYIAVVSVEISKGDKLPPRGTNGPADNNSAGVQAGTAKGSAPGTSTGAKTPVGVWTCKIFEGSKLVGSVTLKFSPDGSMRLEYGAPNVKPDQGPWAQNGDSIILSKDGAHPMAGRFTDATHIEFKVPDPDAFKCERVANK